MKTPSFLPPSLLIASFVSPSVLSLAMGRRRRRMPSLNDRRAIRAEQMCSTCQEPQFSLGLDTYRVPMALHELNRARLVQSMLEKLGGDDDATGVILLEGGKQLTRYDTDHEPIFRQESYFQWAFGVREADCFGAISLPSGDAAIFVPRYDLTHEIFCGKSPQLDEIKQRYGVEKVLPIDNMAEFISSELTAGGDDARLHLLRGLNTDSGNMAIPASFDGISDHSSRRSFDTLFPCIVDCRVYKTLAEVELMKYTHWVSSMAHVEVMRNARPGMMEYQLESLFQHHTYTHGGCRHMSYTCICACGPNPAIMHYGHAGRPNNRLLEDGDIALLDMGAEYHCYASDVTCSFPINGRFSDDQLLIYEAVLAAQVAVISKMRPGVSWPDMHRTAEMTILQHLQKGGILKANGSIDDMIDADLGATFMPVGLGHLIGLDTHDVGGYAEGTPSRSERPGLSKLRTARTLAEGMVLTVEPGCYFIDTLMDMALSNPDKKKFVNVERFEEFRGFGGVRLEDGLLVTKDGCENLTLCPRAVSEVLDVMNGGNWPPEKDVLPEMRRRWVQRDGGKMVDLHVEVAV